MLPRELTVPNADKQKRECVRSATRGWRPEPRWLLKDTQSQEYRRLRPEGQEFEASLAYPVKPCFT